MHFVPHHSQGVLRACSCVIDIFVPGQVGGIRAVVAVQPLGVLRLWDGAERGQRLSHNDGALGKRRRLMRVFLRVLAAHVWL